MRSHPGQADLATLDPLYVANEGRFVAFVPARHKDRTLDELKRFSVCRRAAHIGEVTAEVAKEAAKSAGIVTLHSRIGGNRVLDLLSGEQLPRIC
jgi:hydrogenase expression/formation protein HypE